MMLEIGVTREQGFCDSKAYITIQCFSLAILVSRSIDIHSKLKRTAIYNQQFVILMHILSQDEEVAIDRGNLLLKAGMESC